MALRSSKLSGLPLDVLYLIRDAVALSPSESFPPIMSASRLEESSWTDWTLSVKPPHLLDALSRTCRSIRDVCCPTMFSRVTLSQDRRSSLPRSIAPYVRVLLVTVGDFDSPLIDYTDMLRTMTKLSVIFWEPKQKPTTPDRDIILALSSPTLTTLMLRNFRLEGVNFAPLSVGHLRALDVSQRMRSLPRVPPEEIRDENRCLEALLVQLAPQLQVLRIPGESCRLSFLSAHAWPDLHELVIRGGAPTATFPFVKVLSVMPNLRILAVAVARFDSAPLVLLPANSSHNPTLTLTRLTVSDCPAEEGIFTHLSDALAELSLRDIPRYYDRREPYGSASASTLLLCRTAIRFLSSLPSGGSSLCRLEVVVREDGAQMELLSLIAASCPQLTFLELHQYRSDDFEFAKRQLTEIDVPFDVIATTLSPLRNLRVLRLNYDLGAHLIPLHSLRFRRSIFPARKWRGFLEAQAHVIAKILHWLHVISFLNADDLGPVGWSSWYLHPTPSGVVELEFPGRVGLSVVDKLAF